MPHDSMTRCEQKKEFRRAGADYSRWVEVSASEVAGVSRDGSVFAEQTEVGRVSQA